MIDVLSTYKTDKMKNVKCENKSKMKIRQRLPCIILCVCDPNDFFSSVAFELSVFYSVQVSEY